MSLAYTNTNTTLAPLAPDPIFAAIANHRAAYAAFKEALAAGETEGEVFDAESGACVAITTTAPTTVDGVAAALRYAADFVLGGGGWSDPMDDVTLPNGRVERIEWSTALHGSLASALELMGQPVANLASPGRITTDLAPLLRKADALQDAVDGDFADNHFHMMGSVCGAVGALEESVLDFAAMTLPEAALQASIAAVVIEQLELRTGKAEDRGHDETAERLRRALQSIGSYLIGLDVAGYAALGIAGRYAVPAIPAKGATS